MYVTHEEIIMQKKKAVWYVMCIEAQRLSFVRFRGYS